MCCWWQSFSRCNEEYDGLHSVRPGKMKIHQKLSVWYKYCNLIAQNKAIGRAQSTEVAFALLTQQLRFESWHFLDFKWPNFLAISIIQGLICYWKRKTLWHWSQVHISFKDLPWLLCYCFYTSFSALQLKRKLLLDNYSNAVKNVLGCWCCCRGQLSIRQNDLGNRRKVDSEGTKESRSENLVKVFNK